MSGTTTAAGNHVDAADDDENDTLICDFGPRGGNQRQRQFVGSGGSSGIYSSGSSTYNGSGTCTSNISGRLDLMYIDDRPVLIILRGSSSYISLGAM